jgi:hypothetical protein
MAGWRIEGQYMETCNCSYLCPCIPSHLTANPTEGDCKAAIAMRIDKGARDGVKLDGTTFVVVLLSPGAMAEGNITVGLIIDDKASAQQVEQITEIATGAAGGPMAALAPLVGKIAGVVREPVRFEIDGLKRSVSAGKRVDQACEGVAGAARPHEPLFIENTGHPVNERLALAKATHSRFNVFGANWDDSSGTRNGHFAPFSWSG